MSAVPCDVRLRGSEVRNFDEIASDVEAQIARLRTEATVVYHELVLPSWGSTARHGFPATLRGYVMSTFSVIDLASYYDSTAKVSQSDRMRAFLRTRLHTEPEVAAVAVQLWRHTLMHTGTPRAISANATGREYGYLLHWGKELPRDQHLRLLPGPDPDEPILGLALLYLLDDVRDAVALVVAEWASSSESRRLVEDAHQRLLVRQTVSGG